MSQDETSRHALRKQLFHEALDLEEEQRGRFLAEACGKDLEMLQEIQEMIRVELAEPDFLQGSVTVSAPTPSPGMPETIAHFRILRLLGEGGMGSVYEAEQEHPRRHVALKVLHAGLCTPQMLRRFELESDVLGRLQDPGIARIYEAGSSDSSRGTQPWFAMELVDGDPLTDHCNREDLPLLQRVELLATIADAVQHAHQRGVIHRDLKPGNILVDSSGQPKVLDFGIARASSEVDIQATLMTHPGTIVGTLEYMSPEQATGNADAIDIRTDIYSLGAILYELIAGQPPLRLSGLAMHEALRRVIEDEPAALRSAAPRAPIDLSVLTHKALSKDKEQRYATAAGLAADLRRFLKREPILAQPPSTLYRLRRFSSRNKAILGSLAATFVALIVGLTVAVWQRNEAREAASRAQAINHFLLSDLLASPSPDRLGRDARIADALGTAQRSAERAFRDQPRVAAEVLNAIGTSYLGLGLPKEAEPILRRALARLGETSPDRLSLRIRGNLSRVLDELDQPADAVALAERVVKESIASLGEEDPDTLKHRHTLATARLKSEEPGLAIHELRSVAKDQARILGAAHVDTLTTQTQLGVQLASLGELAQARELLGQTLALQESVLGDRHPSTLLTIRSLGWMLTMGSQWEQALAHYDKLMPALIDVYGADHPYTSQARIDRSQCLMRLGRSDEAEKSMRMAVAHLEKRLGADNTRTTTATRSLAKALSRLEKHEEAIRLARGIVARRKVDSPSSVDIADALMVLGRCHQNARQLQEAARAFKEAIDIFRTVYEGPNDYLAQGLYNLGVVTRDGGNPTAAIPILEEAAEVDAKIWGAEHRHVLADRYNLARTMLAAGLPERALEQAQIILPAAKKGDLGIKKISNYRELLGHCLIAAGKPVAGETELQTAIKDLEKAEHPDDPTVERSLRALLELYGQQGRKADAEAIRKKLER